MNLPETMTRVRAIRKRLEKSNPFSEDRADLEWALSILEDLEDDCYSGEPPEHHPLGHRR